MAVRSTRRRREAYSVKPFDNLDLSLFGRKKVPVVLQSETAECGLACLAMLSSFHGHQADLRSLRRDWAVSAKGMALHQLMEAARQMSLTPRALRLENDTLRKLRKPCILHWSMDHFVVLEAVRKRGITVVDPAVGRRFVSDGDVDRAFTGVALELVPANGFEKMQSRSGMTLGDLFRGTAGLFAAVAQIFVFSFSIQIFILAMPFYSQIVIDDVVVSGDLRLLNLVFVAFAVLAAIRTALNVLRAWLVVYLGMQIKVCWSSGFFSHLIRLPMRYFACRHTGDIQSRYRSLFALQNLVTEKFAEALVDGLMATSTVAVLFLYDARLAAIVLVSVLVYLTVKLLLLPPKRARSQEALVAGAKKDSYFLETIRAEVALKNFGMEHRRESGFLDRLIVSINKDTQVYRLGVIEVALAELVFSLQFLAVVWLAAKSIVAGQLTVGMLVAFLAYRTHFTERSSQLIDKIVEFRLARVHLDRLSDIVETEPEPGLAPPEKVSRIRRRPIRIIEAKNVSFRYARTEPRVLRNVSLSVEAGEYVVIKGASGYGKTTLLKILMGLYLPSDGTVLIDKCPLGDYGIHNYRRKFSAVLQDDTLLAGTLAENIGFFDPAMDMQRVAACAALAAVDRDIDDMPMQYFTLVGDMGAALSGGQRQRIVLARALYKRPEILFLDEASSHLDADTERRIIGGLKRLPMTIVGVAHRAESIDQADRVVRIEDLVDR